MTRCESCRVKLAVLTADETYRRDGLAASVERRLQPGYTAGIRSKDDLVAVVHDALHAIFGGAENIP